MKIVVYCEHGQNAGLELLGQARSMAPDAWIIALHEGKKTESYSQCGADETLALETAADDCAQGSRIAQALEAIGPDAVLFPATIRGRFLSAWAAAKLGTGLTADCTGLSITDAGLLRQTRPAYGNNLIADILCKEKRPQMASVRPGVFPVPDFSKKGQTAKTGELSIPVTEQLLRFIRQIPLQGGNALQSARIVVAGGKGIGGKEGFQVLARLADLLGGAVGATRSAVDAGWISYAHQVGQTGVSVRPELYLAFGISGMIQHTVGMSAAKTVVAVNTDKNAPIFRSADYGIVGDWRETAEYMIRYITERKGIT